MIRVTIGLFSSSWKLTVFFFLTILLFFEYVESNQSNTRDCKKSSQQEQPFFVQSSLFLRAFVSSLLNKESIYDLTAKPNKRQFVFSSLINAFAADNINSLLI